jgi:hypothetical protein
VGLYMTRIILHEFSGRTVRHTDIEGKELGRVRLLFMLLNETRLQKGHCTIARLFCTHSLNITTRHSSSSVFLFLCSYVSHFFHRLTDGADYLDDFKRLSA